MLAALKQVLNPWSEATSNDSGHYLEVSIKNC